MKTGGSIGSGNSTDMFGIEFYCTSPESAASHKAIWPFERQDFAPWKLLQLTSPHMTNADMRAYVDALKVALRPPFEKLRWASTAPDWLIGIEEALAHFEAGEIEDLEAAIEKLLNVAGDECASNRMSSEVYSEVDNILSVFAEECRQEEYGSILQYCRYIESIAGAGWCALLHWLDVPVPAQQQLPRA